jgi:hypothetical protein
MQKILRIIVLTSILFWLMCAQVQVSVLRLFEKIKKDTVKPVYTCIQQPLLGLKKRLLLKRLWSECSNFETLGIRLVIVDGGCFLEVSQTVNLGFKQLGYNKLTNLLSLKQFVVTKFDCSC